MSDLFGIDPNFTLGMDATRYVTHQRGDCPADERCALCLLEEERRRADRAIAQRDCAEDMAAALEATVARVEALCDEAGAQVFAGSARDRWLDYEDVDAALKGQR